MTVDRESDGGSGPSIVVVGEALIDIVDDGSPREIPGGSPANVALGLGRLGAPVEFVTWLGDDDRGHRIAAHLEASGVRLAAGGTGAAHTSTATVRLASDGQPRYEFDVQWDPPRVAETPGWLHVGSIGAFLQPGASTVRDLVTRTASAGGVVSFDPNIRPALLPAPAQAREDFERLAAQTNVLKLSDEDAAWLYPACDTDEVVDRVLQLGVELVVVTSGPRGSVLATRAERVLVPGVSVVVADTVGAGDTYMAALIWQLARKSTSRISALDARDLASIGATSTLAAAITVSRRGADLPSDVDLAGVLPVKTWPVKTWPVET
ncbi:MAG: carbohydrate kinase [Microbacteriaceae bacterium]